MTSESPLYNTWVAQTERVTTPRHAIKTNLEFYIE